VTLEIQERDLEIFRFCLEQKFLTLLQIAKMFFPKSRDIYHRPMKRVCELVSAGYLRPVRTKVSDKRLYMTTSEGVKLLKKQILSGGLRAVRDIDYRTFEHDEWVTDVRIAFERLLNLKGWVCERQLKKTSAKAKVPDGIIPGKNGDLVIEVEKTLKKKCYYERIFLEVYSRYRHEDVILYVMASETDKKWLMGKARSWERIYFVTMQDITEMGLELVCENATVLDIELPREYQGGVHFNQPDVPEVSEEGLEEFYEGQREYDRIHAEYNELRVKGMSDKEINALWGIEEE